MHTIGIRRGLHSGMSGLRSAASGLDTCLNVLLAWQDRDRQRRHLAELDDRLLKDIGLTSGDVARETRKPFWR